MTVYDMLRLLDPSDSSSLHLWRMDFLPFSLKQANPSIFPLIFSSSQTPSVPSADSIRKPLSLFSPLSLSPVSSSAKLFLNPSLLGLAENTGDFSTVSGTSRSDYTPSVSFLQSIRDSVNFSDSLSVVRQNLSNSSYSNLDFSSFYAELERRLSIELGTV
ncbi:MAG: hypothetical protein ACOX6P_06700 [Candidatus Merdivicinus sp.]|jgi:hypothetical protein